jgi:cyclopropane fatty-acyl-phospholipid synthase-like methyltransferase
MAQKIAERFRWAVKTLDVKPDDHLLEIGCGHGIAVSLICEKLTNGKITAMDRSQTMIDAAKKRNASCSRAEFHTMEIAQAAFDDETFDKIFAINVNVFWMKSQREFTVIQKLLKPEGALYLFYEPPAAGQIPEIAAKLTANLQANGFIVRERITSESLLCIIAGAPHDRLP